MSDTLLCPGVAGPALVITAAPIVQSTATEGATGQSKRPVPDEWSGWRKVFVVPPFRNPYVNILIGSTLAYLGVLLLSRGSHYLAYWINIVFVATALLILFIASPKYARSKKLSIW